MPVQMDPECFDRPVGEWPALPPNFWRSYVPGIVNYAYSYDSSRGTGFNSDRMWKAHRV